MSIGLRHEQLTSLALSRFRMESSSKSNLKLHMLIKLHRHFWLVGQDPEEEFKYLW